MKMEGMRSVILAVRMKRKEQKIQNQYSSCPENSLRTVSNQLLLHRSPPSHSLVEDEVDDLNVIIGLYELCISVVDVGSDSLVLSVHSLENSGVASLRLPRC